MTVALRLINIGLSQAPRPPCGFGQTGRDAFFHLKSQPSPFSLDESDDLLVPSNGEGG